MPMTEYSYFCIVADAPHVLKRARNACVFQKGFLVPYENFITKETDLVKLGFQDFVNILRENGWAGEHNGLGNLGTDDLRTNFRFTPAHVKANTGNQSQNVRKAVQTLSHTNAKAFIELSRKHLYTPQHGQALHDSVKIFNDW